jgi:hypothetical protein
MEQLELHVSDQEVVSLSLTDDLCLRLFNWTRLALGIPLPVKG